MIVPAPLQDFLDRRLPWLAERIVLLKAMSFGAIGVLNACVDAAVFFTALATVTSSLPVANVLGWAVAVSFSYMMNSTITFAAESGRKLRLRDYLRFVTSGIAGVTVSTTVLVLVAQIAPVWVAKAVAILCGFLVNFLLTHFVVFRRRPDADERAAASR